MNKRLLLLSVFCILIVAIYSVLIFSKDPESGKKNQGSTVSLRHVEKSHAMYTLEDYVNNDIVYFRIKDTSNRVVFDAINTKASAFSKHQIGINQKDIITLYSSDIGTLEWKISPDGISKINRPPVLP